MVKVLTTVKRQTVRMSGGIFDVMSAASRMFRATADIYVVMAGSQLFPTFSSAAGDEFNVGAAHQIATT